MADTTENYEAKVSIDLGDANTQLVAAYASFDRLFRQVGEAGEIIETPFLQGVDSINRLRGNLDDVSDQFKLFGTRGLKIAESLEKIQDPAKRLALSQSLLKKEMANSTGVFAKLGDKSAELQARFHALPPVAKGALLAVAAGATAAAAAVVKLAQVVVDQLVAAWKVWAAQSKDALAVQEDLEASTSRLQVSLGQLVEHLGRVTDTQAGAGKVADEASGALDKLNKSLDGVGEEASATDKQIADLNRQNLAMLPGVGWLWSGFAQLNNNLADLGAEERKQISLLQATNPLLLTQGALMDRLATSSLQAGTGLESVETAMEETKIEAWKLNQALDELDKKWGSITDLDVSTAVGGTQEAGGGAIAELDKRAKAASDARKNRLKAAGDEIEEESKNAKKLAEQRAKDLQAIEKMNLEFARPLPRSGGAKDIVEKYEGDPGIQKAEKASADLQAGKAKIEAEFKEKRLIKDGEDAKLEESNAQIQNISSSMNDAAKGAVMLGASMAGMALETLIAGDSMKKFGWEALAAFGSFATQAGQVILATGIGELALFEGNPGGAIAAGIGLIAIGSVLGGLAKRNIKKGGSKSSARAETKQIVDSYRNQGKSENEERDTTIFVQFGNERFQQVVATAVTGGQRTGRLPRYATG